MDDLLWKDADGGLEVCLDDDMEAYNQIRDDVEAAGEWMTDNQKKELLLMLIDMYM